MSIINFDIISLMSDWSIVYIAKHAGLMASPRWSRRRLSVKTPNPARPKPNYSNGSGTAATWAVIGVIVGKRAGACRVERQRRSYSFDR
jgi:hypothetical protein